MKSTAARIFLPVAALFFLADALNLQAGNILKTNTVTMVNSTDWAPITTPSFGSVGEFGAAPTALQLSTMTLGANMTLGGLQFDSTMLGPVTIAAGNTLTNGGNGINMSLANTNVTINAALALTNNQSWLVTNGLTLTIGASPNFASSGLTLTIAGGGSTTVNGNLVTPTGSDSSVLVTNGNFTATSVNISRSSANQVAFPTPTAPIWAQPGSGFVVNGPATVASLTTLTIASQNSGSTALVTNGANLTVSGKTLVGDMNATSGGSVGRWSVFQVSGGNFTNSDTTAGGGFVMSPNNGTTTNSSELLITGGNAVIAQIALGAKADTVGGTNAIIINGGNLYLGIGGIALSNTHTFYSSNYLVSGLLGATTNWSSSLPMTLANTTGTPFTIQTANGNGVAHNITLGGVISGAATAPLTTGGGGTLTISAAGTYTGNIVITNGTLSDTFQNNNLNITASGLGNPQTAGRTVTILNGGILSFDGAGGNDLGNAASSGVQLAFFITNGTMRLTSGNTPIGPLTLSGGTVTCTAGSGGSQAYYALFYLNGDVTVGGTSPSTISSASTNASGNYINLTTAAAGTRKFTVAQTGGTGPDLFVSAPLGNGSNATNLVANLVKAGAGTMSLSATNSYTGTTTISGGTLALTNNGSINWSTAITISNGATLDVSGVTGGYTLAGASNQTLNAGGVVNGSLNATNNARIYAGTDLGYGTNTFNNNLTETGVTNYFDVGVINSGANDYMVVSNNLALTNCSIHIKAPSTSSYLGGGDYTLFTNVIGTTVISGTLQLVWDVAPTNFAAYSIVTNGNSVVLHASVLISSGSATPNPAIHATPVFISVTASSTAGIDPNVGVTVNASPIGGSATQALISDGVGDFTNTVTVANNILQGNKTLIAMVVDGVPSTNLFGISITINPSAEIWNGGATPDNTWSNGLNWASGNAPQIGDLLVFTGTTNLTPNMESSYTNGSLTFDPTAGSFNITNLANTLTLIGSVTNNSTNVETVSVPVATTAVLTFNAASNSLVFSNTISGTGGGVTAVGTTNILAGNNSYTGATVAGSGLLVMSGSNGVSAVTVNANAALQLANTNAVLNSVLTLNSGSTVQLRSDVSSVFAPTNLVIPALTSNILTFDANTLTGPTGNTLSVTNTLTFLGNAQINVTGNANETVALGNIIGQTANHVTFTNIAINALAGGPSVTIGRFQSGNWGNFLTMQGGGKITVTGDLTNVSGSSSMVYVKDGTTATLKGRSYLSGGVITNGDGYRYDVANGTLVLDTNGAVINNSHGTGLNQSWFVLGAVSNTVWAAGSYGAPVGVIINTNNSFNAAIYLGDANNAAGGLSVGALVTNYVADGDGFVNSGVFTIGGQNTSGINTFSNPIVLGFTANTGKGVTLAATAGGEVDFNGNILKNGTDASAGVTVGDAVHSGIVKLVGVNTYGGGTTVSNGTLLVNGSISNAVIVATNATLGGGGTIFGSVTVSSGGYTYPSLGTGLTVNGNLLYNTGAQAKFNLTNAAAGINNDQIVVGGNVTNNGVTVGINLFGTALDTTTNYLLITNKTGVMVGAFNPTPIWLGTIPANSTNYSIVTYSNYAVLAFSPVQISAGSATPNPAVAGQLVTISVNAISGGGANPISSVTVNAGVIGGSPTLQLSSSGGNAYTNSVIVAPATVPASYELVFTAIDNVPDTNNGSISLTINTSAEVWNGSASPDNTWSNGANWLSTLPPGTGDPLTFAGVANTTPNMESSYSIGSLTFSNNASPFNITNDGTHTLTLTGGVTNNSAGVQSLSVPVALSGVQTFNAALGSLVFSNPISGSGGGVIAAGTTNIFAGTNTYTGTTAISNSSVLIIGGAGVLGGGFYSAGITDNGTFNYGSTSIQTNSGIISGTGGLTVSAGTLTIGPGLATIGAYTYTGPTLVTNATLNLNFDNQPQTGIYLSSGLTINNGGVVAALGSSAVEGYTAVASNLPVTINVGGMLTVPNTVSGFSAHLYGVLNLNGGTLALAGAINAQYAGWSLNNTVNVNGGINTSYISDMNCIPDQTGGSIFNVTNGGTASGIDLDVVGQLDSTYGSIDTGVILTGNGTMRLNNLNTYSNFTTISNGTFILNGELGSLAAGGPNYPKAILNNGTFIYTTNVTQTLSGVISGTGTLKVNAAGGVLVLSNANTYTGNTIITNGTLRLTNNASINNSSNIVVSGGGMFDVSALSSSFNLGSSLGSFQTLSNDTSMAIIKGNANTRSGTVALTYSVAGTPSFSVTNGILNLTNVTTFNVNNATGSALTPGSYKIISRLTGGSVAVTNALPAVTVGGSGILAGASAALQITSGELYLVVTVTTSSVLTTSGSPTTYGTPVTFTNTITPSGGTISNGYPVVFKDGAAIMGTNTTTSGVATFTTTSTQLAAAVHSSITAVFAGDGIYLASTGSVSQTVQQAPLTPTVSFNSKNYDGTTNAPAVSGYGVSGTVYSPDVVNASGGTVLPYAGKDVTGSPYTIIITNLGLTAGAGTNYALTTTSATNTSSINATNITVTAQPNTKPYDGTTNASTLPVTSFVALGDTASFTEAYTDPNVGTGKTLIPSGTISPAADYNVTAFNNSANGVITALTLTVTNVAVLDHLYDGTTNATLVLTNAGLVGVVNSDNVNLLSNTAAGYFTNKNIGTNLAVFTTLSLTGDATTNNYNLFQPTNVTGNIIATNITVSSQANTKPYDGTTNAAAAPSVTFVAVGDTTNFVEGYFGTGVGTNLALNPSGYVGDGNGGSNYVVTLVTNNVGEIDPTNITVTAGTNIKPYDGTTGATNTPAITSGFLQGSDTGTAVLAEAYVSPNVALSGKALAPSITIADYTNYNVTLVTNNTGVITPLTLTVTNASALNRPYDGTTNATLVLANSGLVGVVNSDNVNLLSNTAAAYFTNKDVGTNLVVVTTLSLIGDATTNNYNLFQPTNITANISSTNIIVRASDNTKNYDSTTNALATPSVSFVAAGDAPSFTEAYADANAGIGKTLTPFGTIAPAADYTVTFSNDLNGVIVPTNITVTAGTNIKPYDGTTGATNTPTIGPGALQGSDTAVLAELYADPNAGTGKLLIPSVVISDYTNYNVTMVTNFTGVITPIATTLTVTSSANPSGYHDGVVFTATNLPAGAVSNVVFLAGGTAFSTNGLGGGYATSLTITNLPRGTNEITAQYLGDGNYLPSTNDLPVGQVVTNHPPVAGASFTIGAVIGTPVTVQIVGGKNPPTDADGDTLAITVSTAAHGTVTTDGSTNVTYTATNGVTDSFTYTVDDGNGGTASQTVNVNISAAGGGNNVAITRIPGFAILNFASVPNTTNVVQLTTNLAYPIIWTPIWTNVAGTNGLWQFIVTNPPLPSAYFRSMRQP